MEVSLDRAACQGDCICELVCAEVFALDEDGIAFVRRDAEPSMTGSGEWVEVTAKFAPAVQEAARDCPTQAISLRDS
jgi:ferredoxin